VQILYALRGAIFFAAGVFITFSADHGYLIGQQVLTAAMGLYAVAGFCLIAAKKAITKADLLLIIVALLITVLSSFTIQIPELSFYFLVTLWGLGAGAIELFATRPLGFKTRVGQERFLSGMFSILIGFLFIAPIDVVSAVGFMGVYFAISGVHWGIAAATPAAK
jgi:uncharacterized membrane protein YwzB